VDHQLYVHLVIQLQNIHYYRLIHVLHHVQMDIICLILQMAHNWEAVKFAQQTV
jgi:hypothetical protein